MTTETDIRKKAWNKAISIKPGDFDLQISAQEITGKIPVGLRGGRLLSNGPGWNKYGDKVIHPFDGHGYLRSFLFLEDGSVSCQARFIRTEVYESESQKNEFIHRGFATNPSPYFWKNIGFPKVRNVANTTIYRWNNKLLAGWEGGSPHAIDPVSLATKGIETFHGAIEGKISLAHMKHDVISNHLIVVSTKRGRDTTLYFHEINSEGKEVQQTEGVISGTAFVHDFTHSKNWYIVGGNPLSVNIWKAGKAFLGSGTLLTAVRADTAKVGELIIFSRTEKSISRRITLPKPVFVVHFVNAFEQDDGTLIVDACIFHDFPFGEEFGYCGREKDFDPSLPEQRGPQSLYRITVPPNSDQGTWKKRSEYGIDFPRVLPEHAGIDAPFMVGATRKDPRYSDPFDSLICIDLHDEQALPKLWTTTDTIFVGEPIPMTDHSTGIHYAAVVLSDGLNEKSTLAIFALDTLEQGPICQIPLPFLPVAFHGEWDPIGNKISSQN